MVFTQNPPATAKQLALQALEFEHFELSEGVLQEMTPSGPRHGKVIFKLSGLLSLYLQKQPIGVAFGAETGFELSEKTVRAPDISFVLQERIPAEGLPEEGFFPGPPDLAVEVLSPTDYEHPGAVLRKVSQYLEAGTALVWVIHPRRAQVAVYRPDSSVETLAMDDTLRGEPVLPGFSCQISQILD